MNPYVLFALAMCGIVLLSLIATAYLAARFNRAAKRDLAAAFEPLAGIIDGEIDLEEARVVGRYAGHIASGSVVRAPNTMGRLFLTEIIDSAGGESWSFTRDRASRAGDIAAPVSFNTAAAIETVYVSQTRELNDALAGSDGAHRLEYDASAGALRLSRPMRARRDIPPTAAFKSALDILVTIGPVNRGVQGAPDADWPGGRAPNLGAIGRGSHQ